MTIQVYPEPSGNVKVLPPGATGTVFEGYSSVGSYEYTTPVTQGTYLIGVTSFGNVTYNVSGVNNEVSGTIAKNDSDTVLVFSTSETDISIKSIDSWGPFIEGYANGAKILYRNPVTVNKVGYLAVLTSTGTNNADWKGAIIATTDGITWTTNYVFTSGRPKLGIVHNGNGLYMVGENEQAIARSRVTTNFTDWTLVNNSTISTGQWLVGGKGLLIYAINTSNVLVSTDGLNWTLNVLGAGATVGTANAAYSPKAGVFVAAGTPTTTNRNAIAWSTNGSTWAWATLPGIASVTTGQQDGIAYGNGYFAVVAGNSGAERYLQISTNGTTWTIAKTFATSDNGPDDVYFADGAWFTRHSNQLNYTDGNNWTNWTTNITSNAPANIYSANGLSGIANVNGRLIYGTNSTRGLVVTKDQAYISTYTLGANPLN